MGFHRFWGDIRLNESQTPRTPEAYLTSTNKQNRVGKRDSELQTPDSNRTGSFLGER